MATWQFDFHFVPASDIRQHFRAVPVTISAEEYDRLKWWADFVADDALESSLSTLLPRARSWHERTRTWGEEEGDRVDVTRDDGGIVDVYVRLDVRNLSFNFLNQLVELARRLDLLFLTEDRDLLRPSDKELLGAIRRSPAFSFVADPEAFLDRLKSSK
jgi:hypothetical protein